LILLIIKNRWMNELGLENIKQRLKPKVEEILIIETDKINYVRL